MTICMIAGFRQEADGHCTLLGYYAASSGNFLPTFQDNLLVPSSGVKNPKESQLSQYRVFIEKSVGGGKSQ